MDFLLNLPVYVKISGTLGIFLIANSLFKKLLPSVILGTVVLAFWSGHTIAGASQITWNRLSSLDNLFLSFMIFLVIWLSTQMAKTDIIRELVTEVKALLPHRWSLAALPAVIGLLPMPGGAIFSAPLVDSVDQTQQLSPLLKTRINYWFRHIWESFWPLYPGVLLAAAIARQPIWLFSLINLPLSLLSLVVGYLFLLRKVKNNREKRERTGTILALIKTTLPIILVILIYALVTVFLPQTKAISRYFPMALAIFLVMIFIQSTRPLKLAAWKEIILNKKTFTIVLTVMILRVYGAFIEAKLPNGILLMEQMRNELSQMGVPILLLIVFIPFLSGLSTGISVGFVGASFPIVVTLIGPGLPLNHFLSSIILAYSSGFMGVMLSPVHLCLIVSNQHFKTSLSVSLLKLLPLTLAMFGGVVLWAFLVGKLPL